MQLKVIQTDNTYSDNAKSCKALDRKYINDLGGVKN